MGAPDATTGYPTFYQDASGDRVRLCVDRDLCVGGDQTTGLAGLANLPDEAFYAYAEAEVTLKKGGRVRWRAVLEGTWVNGIPRAGQQMTFARVQLTGSKIDTADYPSGTTLVAKTPYGSMSAVVSKDGKLTRNRQESAPGLKGDFTPPATDVDDDTIFGPEFLEWTGTLPTDGGYTFLGNPAIPHTIKKGPSGLASVQLFKGTTAASDPVTKFTVSGQKIN